MDYERLASEFLRALRGRRSQTSFNRRLGKRSNVAYRWEAGLRFPSAAEAMHVAARMGHDPVAALERFFAIHLPGRALEGPPDDPAVAAGMLAALRGDLTLAELAERCGRSRHAVARWLSGETRVRLPDFFRVLQEGSHSLLTFLACFVSPATLPSAREEWERVQAIGDELRDTPEALLVFVALGLAGYRELSRHEPGYLASHLGLSLEQEETALAVLKRARVIRWNGRRWVLDRTEELDTRRYPDMVVPLKRYFAELALERLAHTEANRFTWVLLGLDDEGLRELREAQRAFHDRVRALGARDRRVEQIALVNLQAVPLRIG
ncbi:MAG: DUF4423 domain-containing protein [Myxococcota bacterium]